MPMLASVIPAMLACEPHHAASEHKKSRPSRDVSSLGVYGEFRARNEESRPMAEQIRLDGRELARIYREAADRRMIALRLRRQADSERRTVMVTRVGDAILRAQAADRRVLAARARRQARMDGTQDSGERERVADQREREVDERQRAADRRDRDADNRDRGANRRGAAVLDRARAAIREHSQVFQTRSQPT